MTTRNMNTTRRTAITPHSKPAQKMEVTIKKFATGWVVRQGTEKDIHFIQMGIETEEEAKKIASSL